MKKLNKKQKLIILISIITIIVIIGIIIGANIMRTNIANGNFNSSNGSSNNGNLLPEYIKKGITLGGVTGTLESLDTSDATATAEDISWGKTAYVKGEKITGTYLTLGMLEIGDYVAYTPDSAGTYTKLTQANTGSSNTSDDSIAQEDLNWRVLSINDDGTVDLISDTTTSQSIYLQGSTGYNNGVYLLNDVAASLYSNKSLGVTARSLTIEDIEKGMNETGLNWVHTYSNNLAAWGKTYTYPIYRYYPNLYAQENGSGIDLATTADPNSAVKEDGIGQSNSYYTEPTSETSTQANSSLTVTQTYYSRSMNSSYYKNSTFYNLVHSGNAYWLASRYVDTSSSRANFGLRRVTGSYLSGYYLFSSRNSTYHDYYRLRAVVSLKSNIRLGSGDGSFDTPYQFAD